MIEILIGLVIVALAGLGTGTAAWPVKKIKQFHFAQYLFVFMFSGIIFYPWVVVLFKVPNLGDIIETVGIKELLISNLFSVSWGIANILYLLCVVRIGAAITGAIMSAVGISIGVTMPMILKGSGLFQSAPGIFSKAGMIIISGLIVILLGVVLASIAGLKREKVLTYNSEPAKKKTASGNFMKGVLLVIIAGILSSGLSFAFVYSQGSIIKAVKLQGEGELVANLTVWAIGMLGGGIVNIGYAIYCMGARENWRLLLRRKEELLYGSIAGLQFIVSIVLLGRGMLLLGVLGASVGFAIQQSMQIIGNQLVGFIGGEWKGVKWGIRKQMYFAIFLILIAVLIISYSNAV